MADPNARTFPNGAAGAPSAASNSGEPWTVQKALSSIPKLIEGSTSPVPFFHLLERLKTTKRQGWRRYGIE